MSECTVMVCASVVATQYSPVFLELKRVRFSSHNWSATFQLCFEKNNSWETFVWAYMPLVLQCTTTSEIPDQPKRPLLLPSRNQQVCNCLVLSALEIGSCSLKMEISTPASPTRTSSRHWTLCASQIASHKAQRHREVVVALHRQRPAELGWSPLPDALKMLTIAQN